MSINQPLIYVIMRNHNAYELSATAIRSLLELTYGNYRILVIDDGSYDGSGEKLQEEFSEIEVLKSERYIEYCRGLNMGIRYAAQRGAQYFFLVNNDTKDFSPNYLEEVLCAFREDKTVGMVGTACDDYAGGHRRTEQAPCKLGVTMDIPTEGFVVSRTAFETVGLLNEHLVRYFEDLDLIIRIRGAGFTTRFVGTVKFLHLGGGTSSRQIFVPNYYRARNFFLFLKRHAKDHNFGWKYRQWRSNFRVHVARTVKRFRAGHPVQAMGIFGSALLGVLAGIFGRWVEQPPTCI